MNKVCFETHFEFSNKIVSNLVWEEIFYDEKFDKSNNFFVLNCQMYVGEPGALRGRGA